jgi:hypothetical protein
MFQRFCGIASTRGLAWGNCHALMMGASATARPRVPVPGRVCGSSGRIDAELAAGPVVSAMALATA